MSQEFINYFSSEFISGMAFRFAVFFVPASIIFFLTNYLFKKRLWGRKIQQRDFKGQKIKHDVIWTGINRFLLSFITVAIAFAIAENYSLIYTDFNQFGLWYLPLSLILVLVIHDTYFYLIHRFMHHKFVMRHVHRLHHNSTDPTPYTGYAFHPWETVLEFAFLPLIIFILPMHIGVFALWQYGGIMLFSMYAHLGYEIMPRWWVTNPVTKYFNTPTHHNMHHSKFKYNYSLYFNYLDRWFGTQHPKYDQIFLEVTSRSVANPVSTSNPANA